MYQKVILNSERCSLLTNLPSEAATANCLRMPMMISQRSRPIKKQCSLLKVLSLSDKKGLQILFMTKPKNNTLNQYISHHSNYKASQRSFCSEGSTTKLISELQVRSTLTEDKRIGFRLQDQSLKNSF